MLIAHEAPIDCFEFVQERTDFDYALVHLFEKNSRYYSLFVEALQKGREVLLDNSIFELKEAFDSRKYVEWINRLKPSYFIVPDVLEDSEGTINNFKKFTKEYTDLPGLKIGAVQGKTYSDIVECYKFMSDNADYIAISFDFSYYLLTETGNKLERMCKGRQRLIERLVSDSIWNNDKPHHLLGCSLPIEFKQYSLPLYSPVSIRSLDTSNPVMHGLNHNRYIQQYGINFKVKGLLADIIDIPVSEAHKDNIDYNIKMFRKINWM